MKKTEYRSIIKEVLKFGREKIEYFIKAGQLAMTPLEDSYYNIRGFNDDDFENLGYYKNIRSSREPKSRYTSIIWDFYPSTKIFNEYIRSSKYKDVIKKYKFNKEKISLFNKTIIFVFRSLLNRDDVYIEHFEKCLIEIFMDVLESEKEKTISKLFVGGLICSKTPISFVYKDVSIRILRPSPSEYRNYTEKYNLQSLGISSIIEFKSESNNEYYRLIQEILIQFLRLFRVGSITVSGGETRYFFDYLHTGSKNVLFYDKVFFKYGIYPRDVKNLLFLIDSLFERLVNVISLNLPKSLSQNQRKKMIAAKDKEFSIKISINRYNEALLNYNNDINRRIFFAIIGLEALYNTNDDKESIGFKLKFRTSKVLGLLGYDPLIVASNIAKGYDVRSKYAHGAMTEKKIEFNLQNDLIEYLRVSICFFLYFDDTKKSLIENLNQSSYSIDIDKEISAKIKKIKKCL